MAKFKIKIQIVFQKKTIFILYRVIRITYINNGIYCKVSFRSEEKKNLVTVTLLWLLYLINHIRSNDTKKLCIIHTKGINSISCWTKTSKWDSIGRLSKNIPSTRISNYSHCQKDAVCVTHFNIDMGTLFDMKSVAHEFSAYH